MHNPTTRDTWQTAFGKDFGGMAQGDNKTGQQGTDSIFVMTHDNIRHIPTNRTIRYARVVVDLRPQKTDSYWVWITAGGNLINYPGELTMKTADLTTSKLMWNSDLSTKGAKYMCLDIKNFYLTAPLDCFEYMKMPISLFPSWTREQYNSDTHANKMGLSTWKCAMPFGDSHRQESLPTNCSERDSTPMGITNAHIPRAFGGTSPDPFLSH